MKRFFIGRAIGTIVVFAILGIYLLLNMRCIFFNRCTKGQLVSENRK